MSNLMDRVLTRTIRKRPLSSSNDNDEGVQFETPQTRLLIDDCCPGIKMSVTITIATANPEDRPARKPKRR